MIHWLEYGGGLHSAERTNRQLEELQRYLRNNPEAKATGYFKNTGDLFANVVRLECNQTYADLDLECNSGFDCALKRLPRKPLNIEYSDVITWEIYEGVTQEQATTMSDKPFADPEPHIKVVDTDLSVLLLKIHALAGSYMPDAQYNLNILAEKQSSEYIMLMNGRNIFLTETLDAYRRGTTPFDVWTCAEENPDTKAFAIHVRDQYGDGIIGDIVEIDLSVRQLDILRNSVYYTEVYATLKDGSDKKYLAGAWDSLEPVERNRVQNFSEIYDPDGMRSVVRHLEDIRREHTAEGVAVEPDTLLSGLNKRYMETAPNPQPDSTKT